VRLQDICLSVSTPKFPLREERKEGRFSLFWDFTRRRFVAGYRRFGTTYRSHFKESRKIILLCLLGSSKMGQTTEKSISNYQPTQRNIPEERRPQLHRGRSLKYCHKESVTGRKPTEIAIVSANASKFLNIRVKTNVPSLN
jgi:hypothetical protein